MNWLDFVIIIALIVGAMNGARKGFVISITKLIGFVASIYIAKTFYPIATAFIVDNTDMEEKITDFIFKKGLATNLIDVPQDVFNMFPASGELTNNISSFVTISILNAISLLSIFIICRLLFLFIEIILGGVFKLPGLKDVNKMGGLAIGLAVSVLGLLVAFAILIPLTNIGSWEFMNNSIEASILAKYFYSYNFILGWILDSALDFISNNGVHF